MTEPAPAWTASIRLRSVSPAVMDWLEQSLRPEAAREVPRAHAEIRRGEGGTLEVAISASDSGAMRSALTCLPTP